MPTSTVKFELSEATSIRVTEDTLVVELADGRAISVPLDWYPRLVHATPAERNRWNSMPTISTSIGLIWMRI